MTDADTETQLHIERFGCSVNHILAEGELPPFSFSVGIEATSSAPEVVVVGLKKDLAHFIVNEYNRRVRAGESFVPGQRYKGFLEGFEVAAEAVDRAHYKEYFGYNLRYYCGDNFRVLQLVYPNRSGVWPWQVEADSWFKAWQPLLTSSGVAGGA